MVEASLKAIHLTREHRRYNAADAIDFISTIEKLNLESCSDQGKNILTQIYFLSTK